MKYHDLSKIDTENAKFKEWNKEAMELTRNLGQTKNNKIKPHWKEMKKTFIETYGLLCWYSDSDLTGQFVDIDHFRPKRISRDVDRKIILEDGYWWLTYDYKNFRLSSEVVNRIGKRDYFPLKNIDSAGKVDLEEPILLDPCVLSDTKLIGYRENGEICCESQNEYDKTRVEVSVKFYKLDEFVGKRKEKIKQCDKFLRMLELSISQNIKGELLELIIKQGKELLDPKKC